MDAFSLAIGFAAGLAVSLAWPRLKSLLAGPGPSIPRKAAGSSWEPKPVERPPREAVDLESGPENKISEGIREQDY